MKKILSSIILFLFLSLGLVHNSMMVFASMQHGIRDISGREPFENIYINYSFYYLVFSESFPDGYTFS